MSQPVTFHNPELRFTSYLIVPHCSRLAVLMLPGERGWTLPHFVSREHHFAVVGHLGQALLEQFGLAAIVLRCVYDKYDALARKVNAVYLMENRDRQWEPPPGASWASREEFNRLGLEVPEHRAVVADWFDEIEAGELPQLRVPWGRPGWFDGAVAWISTQLARHAVELDGPVEQIRNWGISCILKARAKDEEFYFKAVPRSLTNEPGLVRVLAEHFPLCSPEVLAVDAQRRWMLSKDMGGRILSTISEVEPWEEAMRAFARLQVGCIERVSLLRRAGCPARGLKSLPLHIDALASDTQALMAGNNFGLTEEQVRELRDYVPVLKVMCRELESLGIPDSLEHGDFWGGNIAVTHGRYIIFDWSFSSISHPFFSLGALAPDKNYIPQVPEAGERLARAYLQEWAEYGTEGDLQRAFELSKHLGFIHSALTHHRYVLPGLEPKAKMEMENMVGFYLRLALEHRPQHARALS